MRIALDARPLQLGFREHVGRGIGRYAVELVSALGRRDDIALELWFESRLELPKSGLPATATLRHFPPFDDSKRKLTGSLFTTPVAAFSSRADVFHFLAHGDAPAFMPRRCVVTVHDLILEVMADRYASRSLKYRVGRWLETSAVRNARTLIADSGVTRDDIVRLHHVDPARVHVVHLGVDALFRVPAPAAVAELRARLGLAQPFVLYVGGIDGRKNVRMLVEAFAHARKAGMSDAVQLVFAGQVQHSPEYAALCELARAQGLEDVFRPVGFVATADLPLLFGAADVFAFPSLYEGFGLPPLEAMACGAPVVSTTGGSLIEVLGDAARTAPADDPRAFGEVLAEVMRDPAQRAALRERGLAHAARFTWDRTAEGTVQAYRAALATGVRP